MFKKICEQNLIKKIREIFIKKFVNVKFDKICYYPGFYSSLNDEMGPNGGHFPMRSEIIISKVKYIDSHIISSIILDFLINSSKLFLIYKMVAIRPHFILQGAV
jgi:hypothetical protein